MLKFLVTIFNLRTRVYSVGIFESFSRDGIFDLVGVIEGQHAHIHSMILDPDCINDPDLIGLFKDAFKEVPNVPPGITEANIWTDATNNIAVLDVGNYQMNFWESEKKYYFELVLQACDPPRWIAENNGFSLEDLPALISGAFEVIRQLSQVKK